MKRSLSAVLHAVTLPSLLIAIWFLATMNETGPFTPEPAELVATFVEVWMGPAFVDHVLPSLGRLAAGLAGAILAGVLLGLLIGSHRVLRYLLQPLLEFCRAIPAPVLIPILILLLGIGDSMKIMVIVIGCMWPILLNTIDGVRATDPVLKETARSYGIRGPASVTHLLLPAAMPRIMTGIRQALSIGLILVVISEMFSAVSGLGYQIVLFQRTFKIPEMWSGILLLGLIGLLLSLIFRQIERVVLGWYHGQLEVENSGAR